MKDVGTVQEIIQLLLCVAAERVVVVPVLGWNKSRLQLFKSLLARSRGALPPWPQAA